jgi:hypothetical protein
MLPVTAYESLLASQMLNLHLKASIVVSLTLESLIHFALMPVKCGHS